MQGNATARRIGNPKRADGSWKPHFILVWATGTQGGDAWCDRAQNDLCYFFFFSVLPINPSAHPPLLVSKTLNIHPLPHYRELHALSSQRIISHHESQSGKLESPELLLSLDPVCASNKRWRWSMYTIHKRYYLRQVPTNKLHLGAQISVVLYRLRGGDTIVKGRKERSASKWNKGN